jgi:PIN domain nuclease of toxin-antitoxin system
MSSYLLDTHIWFWAQNCEAGKLSEEALTEIEEWQQKGKLYVSAISVWEIAMATASGRMYLGMSVEHWIERGTEAGGVQILPLTPRTLIDSTRLPGEIHGDPFDRMILATAREHNLTLVTRDKPIVRYGKQGHLKIIKR